MRPDDTDVTQTQSHPEATNAEEPCVMCGGATVVWRKCKLVCPSCGTILKSCADL
jgi:hypothetical protein